MHVKDTVNGTIAAAMSMFCGTINIAPDDSITVRELAVAVMEGLGIYKPIDWMGDAANWRGDNPRVLVDNTLAKSLLKWRPRYTTSYDAIMAAAREVK